MKKKKKLYFFFPCTLTLSSKKITPCPLCGTRKIGHSTNTFIYSKYFIVYKVNRFKIVTSYYETFHQYICLCVCVCTFFYISDRNENGAFYVTLNETRAINEVRDYKSTIYHGETKVIRWKCHFQRGSLPVMRSN